MTKNCVCAVAWSKKLIINNSVQKQNLLNPFFSQKLMAPQKFTIVSLISHIFINATSPPSHVWKTFFGLYIKARKSYEKVVKKGEREREKCIKRQVVWALSIFFCYSALLKNDAIKCKRIFFLLASKKGEEKWRERESENCHPWVRTTLHHQT